MVEPAFAVFADEAYLHQAKELAQVGSALHGVWQGCEEGFSKLTTPLAPGNSTTFCVAGPTDPNGLEELPMTTVEGYGGQHYEVRDNYFAIGVGYVGAYVFWPMTGSGPKVNAPAVQTYRDEAITRRETMYGTVAAGGNFNSRHCPSVPVSPGDVTVIETLAKTPIYTMEAASGMVAVGPVGGVISTTDDVVRGATRGRSQAGYTDEYARGFGAAFGNGKRGTGIISLASKKPLS